jgi:hypothetical protein
VLYVLENCEIRQLQPCVVNAESPFAAFHALCSALACESSLALAQVQPQPEPVTLHLANVLNTVCILCGVSGWRGNAGRSRRQGCWLLCSGMHAAACRSALRNTWERDCAAQCTAAAGSAVLVGAHRALLQVQGSRAHRRIQFLGLAPHGRDRFLKLH